MKQKDTKSISPKLSVMCRRYLSSNDLLKIAVDLGYSTPQFVRNVSTRKKRTDGSFFYSEKIEKALISKVISMREEFKVEIKKEEGLVTKLRRLLSA